MVPSSYHIIENFNQLKTLVKSCIKVGVASFDFETTGVEIFNHDFTPTLLSVSFQPGSAIAIPLNHFENPNPLWLKYLRYFGKNVIENEKVTKFAWNAKFDLKIFKKYGIQYRGTVIDGMLAKYLLNEERPNGLKDMVRRYIPEYSNYEKYDDFDKISWSQKPFIPLCKYGCLDADLTLRLGLFFESYLMKSKSLYKLYRNMIMPASRVLYEAEFHGVDINLELNESLHEKYKDLIKKTEFEIRAMREVRRFERRMKRVKIEIYLEEIQEKVNQHRKAGKNSLAERWEEKASQIMAGVYTTKKEQEMFSPINLNSTTQIRDLLFSDLGFNFTSDKLTEKGDFSTSAETLILLKNQDKWGITELLIKLNDYNHIYATFIKGYKELTQDDGRLHGTFLIQGTVTGRMSSSSPNLQQIPKKEVNPDIKLQLVAPKNKVFLGFDYSQAELRVMAHLSGDDTLLSAFNEGRDPHLSIACKKYDVEYSDIYPIYNNEAHPEYTTWKVRRKQAKQIVFGCIYGIEAKKLSTQLSEPKLNMMVTENEAQKFLKEFFDQFPKVKVFMDKQAKYMEKKGYVKSLFGRRRRCPKIYSDKFWEYKEAVRQAVNMPCQSSASDFALFSSILTFWDIKQGKLPPMTEVLTVHDSLYYAIDPKYINAWTIYQLYNITKNPLTQPYFGFQVDDVQMDVDFTVGINLKDELPFTPTYNYQSLLSDQFDKDSYFIWNNKYKNIPIDKYPEVFPTYFSEQFLKGFRSLWKS
jgi:DNA polymerase-1